MKKITFRYRYLKIVEIIKKIKFFVAESDTYKRNILKKRRKKSKKKKKKKNMVGLTHAVQQDPARVSPTKKKNPVCIGCLAGLAIQPNSWRGATSRACHPRKYPRRGTPDASKGACPV